MQQNKADFQQMSEDYRRIERAISLIKENFPSQPDLAQIAQSVHLSPYHFQRMFTRWVGVSPKRFLQYTTKENIKRWLERQGSLETAYQAGLSSQSRLYDLLVTWEAVTPGELKQRGAGLTFSFAVLPSPFGECLLVVTQRGIARLEFVDEHQASAAIDSLQRKFPAARFRQDVSLVKPYLEKVFSPYLDGQPVSIPLVLQGTAFQIKVWEALLSIPPGSIITYHNVAVQIGLPKADRAVGRAIGLNPVPVLIPCHRAITSSGELGGYRYGLERKQALLAWEYNQFCDR